MNLPLLVDVQFDCVLLLLASHPCHNPGWAKLLGAKPDGYRLIVFDRFLRPQQRVWQRRAASRVSFYFVFSRAFMNSAIMNSLCTKVLLRKQFITTSIFQANMAFIRGLLDRIVLVVGIVAGGCIPGFIAQYRQRVGGRLDQVLKDLEPFQQIANQYHHGSLQELIQHHLGSADTTFHDEGAALQSMISYAEQLRRALQALNTDLFHQLSYLLTGGMDMQIARAAWEIYSPSFNLTVESVVFGSIIGVVIWLVFLFVWNILARLTNLLTAR